MMKKGLIIISVIIISLLGAMPTMAAANIQLINEEVSEQEIIINDGSKMMLDKKWYSYKFEVNPEAKKMAVDSAEYEKALNNISFPIEAVGNYKVYFLNYNLKSYANAMALSFMDDSVVVFGRDSKLSVEKLHQLAVHELGHQVDFELMDEAKWLEYKKLRGIEDEKVYNNSSNVYVNRPQEIFAEDFRLIFGGAEAKKIAHLNSSLEHPNKVEGLREFYMGLVYSSKAQNPSQ